MGHVGEGFLAGEAAPIKVGLYARVPIHEQQTLVLQREAMAAYAQQRRGSIVLTVEKVGSG